MTNGTSAGTEHLDDLYRELRLATSDSIRVLEILPGKLDTKMRVTLRVVSLDANPHYEALSYTWGASSEARAVRANAKFEIPVTDNLFRALRRLRNTRKTRRLWIDALGIDQNSIGERSQQVAMMGQIYRRATCVDVWLGDPACDISFNFRPLFSPGLWRSVMSQISRTHFPDFAPGLHGLGLCARTIVSLAKNQAKAIDQAIQSSSPCWHDRAWVIQEFILGKKVFFCCGRRRTSLNLHVMILLANNERRPFGRDFVNFSRAFETLSDARDEVMSKHNSSHSDTREYDIFTAALVIQDKKATDPKDFVHCILGLVTPTEASLIGADYSLSCSALYAKAMFASIKSTKSLQILVLVNFEPKTPNGLPSWVADFGNLRIHTPSTDRSVGFTERLRELSYPYSDPSLEVSHRYLTLQGSICDKVAGVLSVGYKICGSEKNEMYALVNQAISSALKTLQEYHSTPNKADNFGSLLSLLVRIGSLSKSRNLTSTGVDDQGFFSPRSRFPSDRYELQREAFRLWFTSLQSAIHGRALEPADASIDYQFINSYASEIDKRIALFRTAMGFIGMAPTSVGNADIIALVDSCWPFVILRPNGVYYEFRGFAYMFGFMGKEFWAGWSGEGYHPEKIVLC